MNLFDEILKLFDIASPTSFILDKIKAMFDLDKFVLVKGNQESGKTTILYWLENGSFKEKEKYLATGSIIVRKINDFFWLDTGGLRPKDKKILNDSILSEIETKQSSLLTKEVVSLYVFDVSKYREYKTEIINDLKLMKDEDKQRTKHSNNFKAIGTHATESGLSKQELKNIEQEIANIGFGCRIFELNPNERQSFHPEISKEALKNFIF